MSIIKCIKEINLTMPPDDIEMEGYEVQTTTDKYLILVSSYQQCCEKAGYMSSDDDLLPFIGAELTGITITDDKLSTKIIQKGMDQEGSSIQFVTFYTSRGSFQLIVYNMHNGYYGHSILIKKNDEVLLDTTI